MVTILTKNQKSEGNSDTGLSFELSDNGILINGPAEIVGIVGDCPHPSYQLTWQGTVYCCCDSGCCWDDCSWSTPPADCIEGIPNSQWIYNKQAGSYHVFIGMYYFYKMIHLKSKVHDRVSAKYQI